jgi:hypothetical protein
MARYQAIVQSHRPPEETFAYLATFSNAVRWDPGVLAAGQLDPGPVRPGTRFRLVVPFLGLRLPLNYRVTRLRPDHEVVLTATSGLLRVTDEIVVTGGGAGSVITYKAEVHLRGPLRLLDPLLRPGFRAAGDRAAAGLARALAQNPASQTGTP